MRLFKPLLAFAALTAALPSPDASDKSKAALDEKREAKPNPVKTDNMLILDARIDAHEKKGRTVNLSPRNNARDGKCPTPPAHALAVRELVSGAAIALVST
ncbi:hypothetical protein B0T24DRAFT_596684 [Lasiosphaeria ovina]|uniref:Uncharacterized protein n=1 Tax=Lasiosphaeria ovina TaxID=92902 RepID=A0AAE0JYP0_9PEZI|nr:hypothetical protein B0T24DRAFT_596684 [Lasiosphaeria ovina]